MHGVTLAHHSFRSSVQVADCEQVHMFFLCPHQCRPTAPKRAVVELAMLNFP